MKKIIILILFCLFSLSVTFAADKMVLPTEEDALARLNAEIDSFIEERVTRRTDQKPNARWMALLDSIIVEVHEQFLLEHKAKLDSLKCEEAIWIKLRSAILQEPSRLIKKRLLKAMSVKRRAVKAQEGRR